MSRKIIVVAYATSPEHGSEPGIGWQFLQIARNISKPSDQIYLLTNGRSREMIGESLRGHVSMIALGSSRSSPNALVERMRYVNWLRNAKIQVNQLSNSASVDVIVHHVTFATELFPPAFPVRPTDNIRNIWGPVGSAGNRHVFKIGPVGRHALVGHCIQLTRDSLAKRLGPRNARRATTVLVQSDAVCSRLRGASAQVEVLPNFVFPQTFAGKRILSTARKLKIIFVGQLVSLKRPDLAIRLMTQPALANATLELVGTGPLKVFCERLVEKLGIADRVTLVGELTREESLNALAGADLLLHTSAREGASGVVAEASTLGVPTFCFAGTGAESTLRRGGGSGTTFDPRGKSLKETAEAVFDTHRLLSIPSAFWSVDRLEKQLARIYA